MITQTGYSKDLSIIPEGIVITFGREMIEDQGGLNKFIRGFVDGMKSEGDYWMHKCKNKPLHDVLYVYIIIYNRIYYRCMYAGYETGLRPGFKANGDSMVVDWPRIILAAPLIKNPNPEINRPGFQGFRYCTKLF